MLIMVCKFCQKAAKAGILNFYETLRVEIEPAVGITIVTPGYIESEMTKGKFMTREGRLVVDDEHRDVSAFFVDKQSFLSFTLCR